MMMAALLEARVIELQVGSCVRAACGLAETVLTTDTPSPIDAILSCGAEAEKSIM